MAKHGEDDESSCVGHEPCPKCGSRDNLARYTDGHGYCFGCGHYQHGDGEPPTAKRKKTMASPHLLEGDFVDLPKRGITLETCKHMGYRAGIYEDTSGKHPELDGHGCQIADYRDDTGEIVAQKLRFADKNFLFVGDTKKAYLYGKNSAKSGGRKVVVTEGEIDALTVSQLQGNKWPVVSVANGADGAAKALRKELQWLDQFEEVILFFDDDEQGRKAVEDCVDLFAPGKVKVARVPGYKDANEAHLAGQSAKVIDAIWNAKPYRPDGLVSLTDVMKSGLKKPEIGLPWFSPDLTKLTYGRRWGEVYTFGAGTGIGKTDFLLQQVSYDAFTLKEPVGLFFLEHDPAHDTVPRVLGKLVGKRFHIPQEGGDWTDEDLAEAVKLAEAGQVCLYNSSGSREWGVIKRHVRFMRHQEGIRIFYLDNLTALATGTKDEKEELDVLMKDIANTAQELGIVIHLVTHLATPEGSPHEEGGRVKLRHFRGSRAIGFWTHFAFGIERNTQADTEAERQVMTLRVLKDRYTGQANGKTIQFNYDKETGRLIEQPPATDHGF